MFIVITMAYLIFWGPLFIVTLANYTDDWKAAKKSMAHEVDYPIHDSLFFIACDLSIFFDQFFWFKLFLHTKTM